MTGPDIPSDGHNAPSAIAQSMAKRFNQFKIALPASGTEEIFQLILDNRYKLLGNLVSLADRKEMIVKSQSSLTLLTYQVFIRENEDMARLLRNNIEDVTRIIGEISDAITPEAVEYTEKPFSNLVSSALTY